MKCFVFFVISLVLVASAPLDNRPQDEKHDEDPGLFALPHVGQRQVTNDFTRQFSGNSNSNNQNIGNNNNNNSNNNQNNNNNYYPYGK
ncbi:putative uncharacterized protein DDB_G0292330 [Orbicella faveolata]|uniref:putative uncharacterized protein DDB_G0292330 n=1 Tax=Orbicella faveolata TaxID=48498 RepID=UPI0009E5AB20|nr:putative uncharacterized protein DDB_G0292330 [Orbicella faveolata]